jgi:hypothetical protein
MEKRLEQRQKVRFRLRIRDRHGHQGTYETRDAGPGGLFIETGRLGIAAGEVLWIDDLEMAADPWPAPLAAVVVHRAHDGVGVLLSRPSPLPLVRPDDRVPSGRPTIVPAGFEGDEGPTLALGGASPHR